MAFDILMLLWIRSTWSGLTVVDTMCGALALFPLTLLLLLHLVLMMLLLLLVITRFNLVNRSAFPTCI